LLLLAAVVAEITMLVAVEQEVYVLERFLSRPVLCIQLRLVLAVPL
jgi:hypothetical protein